MASDSETHQLDRPRKLTAAGQEHYEKSIKMYSDRLRSPKKTIDSILQGLEEKTFVNENDIQEVIGKLESELTNYESISQQFMNFLKCTRTVESASEQSAHRLIVSTLKSKVEHAIQYLTNKIFDVVSNERRDTNFHEDYERQSHASNGSQHSNTGSHASHRTSRSSHASVNSELIRQQARLEAAKVKLKYSKQEADILKRKAELEADLQIIRTEQEIDEARSQIKVMNDVLDGDDYSKYSSASSRLVQQRTAEYIQNLNNHVEEKSVPTKKHQTQNHKIVTYERDAILESSSCFAEETSPRNTTAGLDKIPSGLNVEAPMFVPLAGGNNSLTLCNEFSKFMVKRDLLLSRLTKFDDRPDLYVAWRSSFKSIVREMNTTEMEEVDLLVKWLGDDSSRQALRIRAANAHQPKECLRRIWERLEDRFGSAEMVETTLEKKITSFPKLNYNNKRQLFELSDIVSEIESVMSMDQYRTVFAHYNSSSGVNPIVSKLPANLQEKWTTQAHRYKRDNGAIFPPFHVFAKFIHDTAKLKNDPSFDYDTPDSAIRPRKDFRSFKPGYDNLQVSSKKTELSVSTSQVSNKGNACPLHGTNHSLNMCRAFRSKPTTERREFLKKNGLCFRCCGPNKHLSKTCAETIKCLVCRSDKHPTALHITKDEASKTMKSHGEESPINSVNSSCTQVCGSLSGHSKSCAKILLVRVYPRGVPDHSRTLNCLIDDQSNHSLATSTFFDAFAENGPAVEYILSSCSGKFTTAGRRATGYVIEALDNTCTFYLPELIECDEIPNNRDEIPSPELAQLFPHLKDISSYLPSIDSTANVELLIGRDLIGAHHVLDQRIGSDGLPYGQKLPLGWVIIGETCLGKVHQPTVVNSNKTSILENGRPTLFKPCDNHINIKPEALFRKTEHDEKLGYSVEDMEFLRLMKIETFKDPQGQWTAPLPFRPERPSLESNREQAVKRAKSLDFSLHKDPLKSKHVSEFMQKMIDNKHAEIAPQLKAGIEHWYLPIFPVYHPKKPEKVRMVFDSSAKQNGHSLNDVLMKGPDLTNNLLGILLRFRKESVAVTTDVEQMFYNFKVCEEQRNFLRFIWHEDNDVNKPHIDYRMTVHVFGNRPSPAVATYGLRKSVENADQDVIDFIGENFYVDDGLISCNNVEEATSLIKRSQHALYESGRLKLHKIVSNSKSFLDNFNPDDLATNLKNLDLASDELPMQRSLGLSWDIDSDQIVFNVNADMKPFTRRGVLSTINSLFDPIGFAAPVVIQGKLILREMLSSSKPIDWDDPLSEAHLQKWESWVTSLSGLESLRIPRMYSEISYKSAIRREIHIFSDASKAAIGAAAYLKLFDINSSHVSFLLGKAKVAPPSGHTIPRLELCAAVMAVELADSIKEYLGLSSEVIYFYIDSQVVLGYISNNTRRFHVYVSNRVSRIRFSTEPGQWNYVTTDKNPADIATRSIDAKCLKDSPWIHGPSFLSLQNVPKQENFPLINPDKDLEIRTQINNSKTIVESNKNLGSERFSRFSEWSKLVSAISFLKHSISARHQPHTESEKFEYAPRVREAEQLILREVQSEAFPNEITCIKEGKQLPRNSSILSLRPILDQSGILRVGGRLGNYDDSDAFKKPVILPKGHHVSLLLIRHFHHRVKHQGRHLTEGAIRNAGFWIVGAKRQINSVLQKCVTCKKLRGKFCSQQMADLPADRLKPSPAFTFVGVDTFGPWPIIYRRTRGGQANQKRWALLFTCLVSRAVHIEVIEELSSSSFINALRRFLALRGPVQQFRSDRGTNFVGATEDLLISSKFVENDSVKKYLSDNGISWSFNPPHASHMGGVWERLIGVARWILDSILLSNRGRALTHEVLTTFMAEVTAIINARPLAQVSTDSESPSILTPSMLLTQKTTHEFHPFPEFESKDSLKSLWKHVQVLAQEFWKRWHNEYITTLQTRQKWKYEVPNLNIGSIVLLKDSDYARNSWPMAIVNRVFPSADGKVRKVEVRLTRDGKSIAFIRPINELVPLLEVH